MKVSLGLGGFPRPWRPEGGVNLIAAWDYHPSWHTLSECSKAEQQCTSALKSCADISFKHKEVLFFLFLYIGTLLSAMAQSSYAYDNDSPLAIVSLIAGILTFLAALVLGLWIRVNNWQSAERERSEERRVGKECPV